MTSCGQETRRHTATAFSTAGFTLIELIVVMAIMVVITGVTLFNSGSFNSAILLRNLAYTVGLSLREAQLYGVAVHEAGVGSGNFSSAYGVYLPSSVVGTPNASYPLFADLNNNGIYDDGASADIERFAVQNNFLISNFCAISASSMQCASVCPGTLPSGVLSCLPSSLQWMAVSFRRPDPNAIIMTDASPLSYSSAMIFVSSRDGSTRSVSLSSIGQISVNEGTQ